MSNESVINAIRTALDADPSNLELRSHLAELLREAGSFSDADVHYQQLLQSDPANISALKGAQATALALQDEARAAGYSTLLVALGQLADDAEAPQPVSNVHSLSPSASSDDVDAQHDQPAKLALVQSGDDSNVEAGPWEDFESPITLEDVGGMEAVKERLELSFLGPMRNPELRKMYAKSLKGGLMLYGPPGCGKTFIARALAGELGARFFSVGLADVLDMWVGESERKLHEIFETARRNSPAVIFFDEIDALGQKRSQQRNSGSRNIVNQLLSELDSTESDNTDVFVLGATNHPWDVDTALRRPGRFDRTVLVLPPDVPARLAVLEYHLRDRPVKDLALKGIAEQTALYSGADLAYLCEIGAESAMADSMKSGKPRPISQKDLLKACGEIKPSTRAWFDMARNYAMFANESGSYDELLAYMKAHKLG